MKIQLHHVLFLQRRALLETKQTAHECSARTHPVLPEHTKYRNMCLYDSNKHAQVKKKKTQSKRKRY